MKKSTIALYVVAALLLVGAVQFFVRTDIETGAFSLVAAAVCGFLGYRGQAKQKAAKAQVEQEVADQSRKAAVESETKAQAAAESKRKAAEYAEAQVRKAETLTALSFKVAGVTYNNDDGTKRQAILKRMAKKNSPRVTLEIFNYQGSPAVAVLLDNERVGSVPAERVVYALPFAADGVNITSSNVEIGDFENDNGKRIMYCEVSLTRKL